MLVTAIHLCCYSYYTRSSTKFKFNNTLANTDTYSIGSTISSVIARILLNLNLVLDLV